MQLNQLWLFNSYALSLYLQQISVFLPVSIETSRLVRKDSLASLALTSLSLLPQSSPCPHLAPSASLNLLLKPPKQDSKATSPSFCCKKSTAQGNADVQKLVLRATRQWQYAESHCRDGGQLGCHKEHLSSSAAEAQLALFANPCPGKEAWQPAAVTQQQRRGLA